MEHDLLNLFLDDERFPPEDGRVWRICRTYKEAVETVTLLGPPDYISFDHDLGDGPTGHDFSKWLIDYLLDTGYDWNGKFFVHSQNPIGKENIEKLLDSYLRFK